MKIHLLLSLFLFLLISCTPSKDDGILVTVPKNKGPSTTPLPTPDSDKTSSSEEQNGGAGPSSGLQSGDGSSSATIPPKTGENDNPDNGAGRNISCEVHLVNRYTVENHYLVKVDGLSVQELKTYQIGLRFNPIFPVKNYVNNNTNSNAVIENSIRLSPINSATQVMFYVRFLREEVELQEALLTLKDSSEVVCLIN